MKTLPTRILATAAMSLTAAMNIQGAAVTPKVPTLLTTFTNPTPAVGDQFGASVAAMGTDRVLIGAAYDNTGALGAGVAYLFSTDGGVLLTVFTNPTPAGDLFGISVAAVGTNRVVIGAPYDDTGATDSGAAYLFNTNGTLLTTFTNPAPAVGDSFGLSVAAVGTGLMVIGAPGDDTVTSDAGAAYLFSTNGALLTTFTNPTPAANDLFGYSVAAVGSGRVLIGALYGDAGVTDAGAVYLFNTNGTLLTTFTNPTPAAYDYFGSSVAAVGTDGVLVGAFFDDTSASHAGAAYLFGTNGALLTIFTNPTPAIGGYFGYSVAAMGTDRVLVGATQDDRGAINAGAAYLFSTNGMLLTTITNPTPTIDGYFGSSVAAVGTDQVLIGAFWDDTGADEAGAAYLFSLKPLAPSLSTSRNPSLSTLTISWPAPAEGWLLEGTNALPSVPASAWTPVPPPYQTNAGTISVTLTNSPATGNQFFRLRQP